MFHQILEPVASNLFLSFLVGFIPILVVLILLGIVRLPAWQAALAGLVVAFIIAITVWQMPVGLAANSVLNGFAFAILPVMWIVWNAMWLYNITVRSGKFELFRRWMVYNVPPDKRILLLIIGFSFGALMEGIAGFGTPVAIGSAFFSPSNPTETGASAVGERDVPVPASSSEPEAAGKPNPGEAVRAWLPWVVVSLVVILATLKWPNGKSTFQFVALGLQAIKWPGLNNAVFLTLYSKPYAAVYSFQPLGTGTMILIAVILTAIFLAVSPRLFFLALADTWKQLRFAILTVMLIIGMAYLFNYSGMAYTVGLAISKVGAIFPFFSVFLGWIACFLSGSDTSSNALFGNLQVVAARQLNLSPVLMAATNSSGAVMSKMISPQNVTTGVSTTTLVGKEGLIIRRTFFHSIILAVLLGLLVMAQQYLIPGIIPH